MSSESIWKSALPATVRYENIAKIKTFMEEKGLSATGNSHKAAFAAESEAYSISESIEAYSAACSALTTSTPSPTSSPNVPPSPTTPGLQIGPYPSCHLLADSPISTVYRSSLLALKVQTSTHDILPHNPLREIAILKSLSHPNIITLHSTFRDQHNHLVLVFPFIPYTLASVLHTHSSQATAIPLSLVRNIFADLFAALAYLHAQGIIHRDIKPSNILLSSPSTPITTTLIDFGTAYHPLLSPSPSFPSPESPTHKQIEVGSTSYRSPESLFGHHSYTHTLDLWSTGVLLAQCLSTPPSPLFTSREPHEDGNQLGLILSMFKTLGTPTPETWPEARGFKTGLFEWYAVFPGKSWVELLPNIDEEARDLVESLVKWEGGWRLSSAKALDHPFFKDETSEGTALA